MLAGLRAGAERRADIAHVRQVEKLSLVSTRFYHLTPDVALEKLSG